MYEEFRCKGSLEHPVFAMVHAILLGRRGLKSISTILIGILIAIIAYDFTTFSFIIQGIISAVICAFIFFINLHKLWTFIVVTNHIYISPDG